MVSRRRFALGLAALPILAACGGSTPAAAPTTQPAAPASGGAGAAATQAPASSGGAPQAAAAAKSTAPVNLIWDTFRGVGTPYPDAVIKPFQAKFPNVTIEFRPLPTSQTDSYPKLYSMWAAGNIGDLYSFDPVDYEFYRAMPQGLVKPLDDYIAAEKFDSKQFYDPYWELQKLNGKVWGLPAWGHPGDGGYVFNQLALDEVGLKLPDYTSSEWTMDNLRQTIVKLHKASGGTIQRYGTSLGLALRHQTVVCRAYSGEIISEDGKKSIVAEANPAKGMRWAYDLCQTDKAVALPGSFQGTPEALFGSGKLASMQAGALAMFNLKDAIKDPSVVKLKAVLFPKRPDGIYPSQTRGGTWQVGARTKAPDWGWEFVKYLSSRDGCLAFTKLSKSSVALVRPDIMDDPFFNDPNFTPYKETLLKGQTNVVPANSRGTELQDAFAQAHQVMYLGKMPFDQGLKDLSDALQRVLDKPTT